MSDNIKNQAICLKQYISEKEYKEIGQLEEQCRSFDKTILKLELDYKLTMEKNIEIGLKEINEFLYYVDNNLVAYLGITSYGGGIIGEINGMTHPDFRRNGVFKNLFELAIVECKKRSFDKLLLLSDGKSNSGIEFINSVNCEYDHSEYRMKLGNKTVSKGLKPINFRKAVNHDSKEIVRLNAIIFGDSEDCECFPEENEKSNRIIYMVELGAEVIGKIDVYFGDNSAFIYGFGILPEYRGKGYGKAALNETLNIIDVKNITDIELDVECKNSNALDLYKYFGFQEKLVMKYYKYRF